MKLEDQLLYILGSSVTNLLKLVKLSLKFHDAGSVGARAFRFRDAKESVPCVCAKRGPL